MPERRVLVVEDDPMLRDLTKRQLTKLRYDAAAVGSGEEAVAYDHSQISLIFMDIGLPGIDGTHATLLIREKEQREQLKRIPIVALTGHSDAQKSFAAGMDEFLQKPALIPDIKKILDRFLP